MVKISKYSIRQSDLLFTKAELQQLFPVSHVTASGSPFQGGAFQNKIRKKLNELNSHTKKENYFNTTIKQRN